MTWWQIMLLIGTMLMAGGSFMKAADTEKKIEAVRESVQEIESAGVPESEVSEEE